MTRAGILLIFAFLSGCSGSPPVADYFNMEKHLGKVIEFRGKAVNAKLSAAVVGESMMVYCIEIPEWSDDVSGRVVTVTGRLEKSDQFRARTGPSGERSAGTAGGDYLLRSVSHRLD